MRSRIAGKLMLAGLILGLNPLGSPPTARGADEPTAKGAIAPAAPELPADLVTALQEKRFDDAVAALNKLASDPKASADDRAYYGLIAGTAHRLNGKLDPAREALGAAIKATPRGKWAAKLRSELAAVELAARRYEQAEALARDEAETLLAGDRKDRLAEVYHAFARRLLTPELPTLPADPEGAYALLDQARSLAKGQALRARLLLAMTKASQAANNHGRAIQNLQAYLGEYPDGAERPEVRYQLGRSLLAAGQPVPARIAWTDLARDLEKADSDKVQAIRAQTMFDIAHTFGIPGPPDDAQLELGVAALERFLAAYPTHKLAARGAFEIGSSYQARGKTQQALDAYTAFLKGRAFEATTDEARRDSAELSMAAQFQVGQLLLAQEKFQEAIDAFKGYLAKYPNGPQSADAQRAILDTQLAIANDLIRREKYAEARTAWEAFVAQNPLDGRVPQVSFQIGESFVPQQKYDDAIAAWETLAGKFPGTEPAAHGLFLIASIVENEKGEPAEAIERFKKVAVEPWASQARQRIAIMESKALTVVTPRVFRSGEAAHLKISTRNLEKLTFTAYRLDPEAYFRKKHMVRGVEALDISLVQPDAEWAAEVPKYAKYKPVETTYDLKDVKLPGVYVVKVSDEKALQATTLVLGSDLDAIVKTSREQILVFAQDMKTGKGRAGARVLVSDGARVLLDANTGKDGVLLRDWEKPRDPNSGLQYLVLDAGDAAGSGLALPGNVAQGLTARAYLSTDRPAYRPGQTVELRGVVREVVDGQYANVPKAVYKLEVTDSRGRQFLVKDVTLSDFGTFHQAIALNDAAPVGSYRVRLYRPGKGEFAGTFEVQAYQLQKVDLTIDLPRTVYFRGETIKADVIAKYQYGTPLADRAIRVGLPDGRVLEGKTDAEGKYHVELPTEGFAEEQALRIVAQLPEDNVAAAASVMLALRAFRVELTTKRDVYLDGETFALNVTAFTAQGDPAKEELTVTVLKRVHQAGRVAERQVDEKKVTTGEKTGAASVDLKVDDPDGGEYVVRVAGTDRFKNPVVSERVVTVSGKKDETRLRLLSDRTEFKVGETAKVNLHSRSKAGTALLVWEADRVLDYKLVEVREGDNPQSWEVAGKQFPNFTLTAARMDGDKFQDARLDIAVERDLRVTLKPVKDAVGPGDEVEVEVTTADQLGRPVSAEIAVALVDQALLRLYGDRQMPIGQFFYSQSRTGAFATESTNTFRYEPATVPVPEAVVEEGERQKAEIADQLARHETLNKIQANAAMASPAAPAAADPISAGGGLTPFRSSGGLGAAGEKAGQNGRAFYRQLSGIPREEAELREGTVRLHAGSDSDDATKLGEMDADRKDWADRGRENFGAFAAKRKTGGRGAIIAQPRQRFVETAYWNPSVVTDASGKARLKFKAPTALSRYRFTARGTTAADTLVGQANADLAVRQDFFVDLKTPASLTQGDKPRFLAQVHHKGVTGKLRLVLNIYAGGREQAIPKELDLKADGVADVLFEPFDVPDGDVVRLSLNGQAGELADKITVEVPIRPWGVQAFASASGTSNDDATAFVGLRSGRAYDEADMLITVSPGLRRMLVELALGRDAHPMRRDVALALERCLPPVPDTTADRASDLIAVTGALGYLTLTKAPDAPEAARLIERARGLVAGLVAAQNDDGGWPWVAGSGPGARPSERMASARATFALATAEHAGLLPDLKVADKAITYLAQELGKLDGGDHETRAAIVHALSTRGRASFEQANALNRLRQDLPDVALAYLAITFANMQRPELAGEVLNVLGPRAEIEAAGPGTKPRKYWDGGGKNAALRAPAEITALAALAYSRARPGADELAGAIAWLEAHRLGDGWQPHSAKGAALSALVNFYGKAEGAEDRYRLIITVNDTEVGRVEANGPAQGATFRVPRRVLKAADKNRVKFDIEGRGRYGYSVVMTGFARDFGPDQDRAGKPFGIHRRVYWPANPTLDGKPLPQGFGVAVNAQTWENTATMTATGGRFAVGVEAFRDVPAGQPAWEREFLVMEEYLPAGTTLVEGSVQTGASHYEYGDGKLTAYFAPDQHPSLIYEAFGHLPGQYHSLPARLYSAYEPGRQHLGAPSDFKVLDPGQPSTDPRKQTPDELYARGKADFDAGRLARAAESLEALWGGYSLRDDVAKDAARMLLTVHIRNYNPRKVVTYFEVLKQKAPELVIPFDDIRVVGRAYGDIGEHERAFLVWRATSEASYLEDARVGEVLRQKGKTLEGIAFLLDLWREYPETASIRSDFFALSQVLANKATVAITDPATRRELAAASVTKTDLLAQSIRLVRAFLAQAPTDPLADEASLALVGSFLELEDFPTVVRIARISADLYPRSTFLDSFQYSEALGRFHLGEYDRAIAVAEKIAAASYRDAAGVEHESPNKWQALYILGQIYDARRQPAKALAYYERVAERFSDAAGAIAALKRKELTLPEVTVVRPSAPAVARDGDEKPGVGLRNLPLSGPERRGKDKDVEEKPVARLDYRNIATADIKVYPVDLMRLYLTRRNLNNIAGIDLAGIKPLVEKTVKLGEGADYDEKARAIDLPIRKEGAYLVMVRGDDLYASEILLVSPLELEVIEDAAAGRVRVTVRDARTGEFAAKVQVKVIGTANPAFLSGQTDLRGVFVAEGVRGNVSAVARRGTDQYAFYRGTAHVGQPPQPAKPSGQPAADKPAEPQSPTLEQNLRDQNYGNQMRNLKRLEDRYNQAPSKGVQVEKAR